MFYLDNAASAPLHPSALQAMEAAWEVAGNPSSLHSAGRASKRLVEDARELLAADLGAHPSELIICSGGTEANNLALRGLANQKIAISAVEHASIAMSMDKLAGVRVIPVDENGHLELAELDASCADLVELSPITHPQGAVPLSATLVSVQWVNAETGICQPIDEVVARAHQAGAVVHCDAVQALGHFPIDFAAKNLDAMTVTAHKVGGPVGIGALVVKRGIPFVGYGFGGEQETRRRPGTVPVALLAGFAAAVHEATTHLEAEDARLQALHDWLISEAIRMIPGVQANCVAPCSPAIVNLTFPDLRADDLLLLLDQQGICSSAGSACTAGVNRPSSVLLAMGRSVEAATASLRFSFGWLTTYEDVAALLEVLPAAVEKAQAAF